MQNADILIIGQGIAGTCLAFALLDRGLTVQIVDDAHASAASLVQIAVINPVTGRRYAKSWEIDTLIPTADVAYSDIALHLGKTYHSSVELLQILPDERIEEIWMMRNGDPEFQPYLHPDIATLQLPGIVKTRYGRILNARHLQISSLLMDARSWFEKHNSLHTGSMNSAELDIKGMGVKYAGKSFRHVVFCEGAVVTANPYFKFLEVYPMKGEYLICHIPGLALNQHLKSNVSLIPLGTPDHYWCGSTYDRYNQDANPTTKGREYLLGQLSKMVESEVRVMDQGVGIRATTRDRRPYLGAHPDHPQVHLVTGLGTKGASLAPFCANLLADHLTEAVEIPDEVNILRHTGR
jgi:glycine/D-amino acid oxidase-like deaminating enzyme